MHEALPVPGGELLKGPDGAPDRNDGGSFWKRGALKARVGKKLFPAFVLLGKAYGRPV